jgi:hypothetical protein
MTKDAATPYIAAISDRLSQIEQQYPEKSTFEQIKDFSKRLSLAFTNPSQSYAANSLANTAI